VPKGESPDLDRNQVISDPDPLGEIIKDPEHWFPTASVVDLRIELLDPESIFENLQS